ncbi:MAG: Xaa-Pro peptidase family protein [Bariatricus massiliensis]|nr:Xaa-Pro peptidase family protein [Bariatricus massiliensis]
MKNEQKLLTYMEEHELPAFYVSSPSNVRYISGYTGDDSYLLLTQEKNYFITDSRYTEQASYECPEYEILNWREAGTTVAGTIAKVVEEKGLKAVGFEADEVLFSSYRRMEEVIKAELVPTQNVIETFRAVKSEEELAYSRIACDIASRAFEKIIQDIRVGVTEKELASKLSHYMVMEGADTKPYGGILISGARTSLLHGIPSSKAIEYGDFVLMDYGCQYNGYLSDMTRTVVVGKATPKQKEVYRLEQQMVEDVEAVMRPGATGLEAYEASLKAIKGTEYEKYNYGGIGHGIGVFVHEIPFMGSNSTAVLEEGNIVTVEPGIYIPGWGGVRIEDQVLITKDGIENLITARKELIEL